MCTTRCPQGIKITDLLYALKRLAMETGLYPSRFPVYVLSRNFVRLVRRFGRNHEPLLLALYHLKRNPVALLRELPLAWKLFKKGRISLFPARIKGVSAIREMLEASKGLEIPRDKAELEYTEGMVGYRAVERSSRAVAG
jgi:heterodisulfide reductase subunit C